MKKILLIMITVLLLVGCHQEEPTNFKLKVNEEETGYKYTVKDSNEEFVLKTPTIERVNPDSQIPQDLSLVYSLNPLRNNKNDLWLTENYFFKKDEIDNEMKQQIYNYALYGYGYWELSAVGLSKQLAQQELLPEDYLTFHGDFYNKTKGDNASAIRYYLATQELIWETIVNPETNKKFVVEFKDLNLDKEKKEISELLVAKNKSPYFGGNVLSYTNSDVEEARVFELVDENNVLSSFDYTASPEITINNVDGSTLSFTITHTNDNLAIKFIDRFRMKNQTTMIFSSTNDVSYLVIGSDQKDKKKNSLDIELAKFQRNISLLISTHDSQTQEEISGFVYHVSLSKDFNTYIESTISLSNSSSKVLDLVPGNYYIKQIKAPEGYQLNEQVKEVRIDGGIRELTVGFINEKTGE